MTYNIFDVNSKDSRMIAGEINILSSELAARPYQVDNFISSKSGTNQRIYGRNAMCRFIDKHIAEEFINNYHIQPLNKSKIKFAVGLFFNNILVSVMTFGHHPRKGKSESSIALNRLCTIKNITVIGGASKLLKHFIKSDQFTFDSIISWADNRLSSGGVYLACGFTAESVYNKDYFYAKNNIHYNKQNFRKSKIDCGIGQTERERMVELGYLRHKDLGKTRFVLTIKE